MKKIIPFLLSLIFLATSCTLEKRRYRDGFYFKKNKKVETTPTTDGGTTTDSQTNNNGNQNNSNQTTQNSQHSNSSSLEKKAIPAFCIYAGLQEGNCTLSLNAEKIFCFNPYLDCFGRAGVGLSDLNQSYVFKKFIFSGGIGVGFPMLKIGAEYGYSGFMNGNSGNPFYGSFIRFVPKRKSVYLKFEIWKAVGDPENKNFRGSCGLGISF